MSVIWVVILTTLITFCLYMAYRRVYWSGYRAGANKVLSDWKECLLEDDIE